MKPLNVQHYQEKTWTEFQHGNVDTLRQQKMNDSSINQALKSVAVSL